MYYYYLMIIPDIDRQLQPHDMDGQTTNDSSIIAGQLETVLQNEFKIEIAKEVVEFVIEHIYKGLSWIFKKANVSVDEMGIYIQDFGKTQASILNGGNGQMLVINPKVFEQINIIFNQAKEANIPVEELGITLESEYEQIPKIDCLLSDYLEHIGVEEGTHWIQELVSNGENHEGFVKSVEATRIAMNDDEDGEQVLKKYLEERDHLEEQTKPHEINAKYWVNEYFKEKYHGESPFEGLYQALKKISEKKNQQKKKFNILKAFGIGSK